MADIVRVVAIGGTVGALVAGSLAAPEVYAAFAVEPVKAATDTVGSLFPKAPAFDAGRLRKFDITFDDSISTEVQHVSTIAKIEYGRRTYVSIVTTPSGTYSSDALASPYIKYPGIDVAPKYHRHVRVGSGSWTSSYGTSHWTSVSVGSFTYYSSSYTPATRR